MKPRNQGSLLSQITAAPKAVKRVKNNIYNNDDMVIPDDQNFQNQESIRSKIDNSISFGNQRNQEVHVKSDSSKQKSYVQSESSEEEYSQEPLNAQSSNSADKYRSQSNLIPKGDKRNDLSMNKTNPKILVGPANDDSVINNAGNRISVPLSTFSVIPQYERQSKQRSSSNATAHEIKQKEKIIPAYRKKDTNNNIENNEKKEIEELPKVIQTPNRESIQNEDLIKKVSEPIRRRLVVNIPSTDFETRRIQVTTSLNMAEQDVHEISKNVMQMHDSIIQLSRDSREISEKSMDLTQTTEAVMSKVNVMADWIDGLEKVGSGLKIQLIEYIVKFVSFLSSLLLLIYQTIRKANPLALFRNKRKKNPPLKVADNDNDNDD